jgi:hypothetical protein
MPPSTIRSTPGFTQAVWNDIQLAASSGSFQAFNPSGCQGVSAGGNIKIAQTASGLALTGVTMALELAHVATFATLAPFTFGISAIIGLFPLFFAHHAAAVAQEQKVICAAVPAAQNYLQEIESGVRAGYATPQQGIAALQSLLSDFQSKMSSIIKNDASHCNAACVWVKELTAIVAYQSSMYQDMANAQAAAPKPTAPAATSPLTPAAPAGTLTLPSPVAPLPAAPIVSSYLPAGTPTWLGWLALLVGGYFVMEAL